MREHENESESESESEGEGEGEGEGSSDREEEGVESDDESERAGSDGHEGEDTGGGIKRDKLKEKAKKGVFFFAFPNYTRLTLNHRRATKKIGSKKE